MTANQKFAKAVQTDPAKALRIANLVAQGITVARAIKYVEIATKEGHR